MGLFEWLTFPVSAPLRGVTWLGQKIVEQAEREIYDEERIRERLTRLSLSFDLGEITEEEYLQQEELLLEQQSQPGVCGTSARGRRVSIPSRERGGAHGMKHKEEQATVDSKTLALRVAEALPKDAGRGVVRLDPLDLERLGADIGNVVEITGKETAVARAMPAYPDQRGQGLIQMDGILRATRRPAWMSASPCARSRSSPPRPSR